MSKGMDRMMFASLFKKKEHKTSVKIYRQNFGNALKGEVGCHNER
jgi:hypothetical protein